MNLTIKELRDRGIWEKACEIMARDEDAGRLGSRSGISSDIAPIQFTKEEVRELGIVE